VVVLNPGGVITDSTARSLRDRLANPGDFSHRMLDSPDHSLEALGILRGSSD
jgi:hypothetical protein